MFRFDSPPNGLTNVQANPRSCAPCYMPTVSQDSWSIACNIIHAADEVFDSHLQPVESGADAEAPLKRPHKRSAYGDWIALLQLVAKCIMSWEGRAHLLENAGELVTQDCWRWDRQVSAVDVGRFRTARSWSLSREHSRLPLLASPTGFRNSLISTCSGPRNTAALTIALPLSLSIHQKVAPGY